MRSSIKSKPWFGNMLVHLIYGWLSLVHKTNRLLPGSTDGVELFSKNAPAIFAIWHGQHFMVPFLSPTGAKVVTLFSRSADAEINAKLAERMGFETVRGSGGRDPSRAHEKGGVKALIALKRALDAGKSVVMIADISKSTPRQSGLGVITLAKISGRPIIGVAYASSRRRVLAKSWDKTTINLPFGRASIIASEPMFIPKDANDDIMEACRAELDAKLNLVTKQAYTMVDKHL
ncbi:MAG: lysophospholipid acyltransferase family protein [Rhizobiaceae bacterium]